MLFRSHHVGGCITTRGPKDEVLADSDKLSHAGLRLPPLVELLSELRARGLEIPAYPHSPEYAADRIASALGKAGR